MAASTNPANNQHIRKSPLLENLPEHVVNDFLERARLVRVPPQQHVFKTGDAAAVYLVVTGRVKIVRTGEHGRENILIIAGPGELLGSLNIFEQGPQPTSGIALNPTVILQLSAASMLAWLETHREAAMQFMRLIVHRLQRQNDAMHDVYGLDVSTRVARAIVREARRYGRRTTEGIRVDLALSQEELALHVRASRESVNQALSSFTKQGWIRRDGTEIIVLDEMQLEHRARSNLT